jgi:HAD superfamily hydrolase (TIGR01509 family)
MEPKHNNKQPIALPQQTKLSKSVPLRAVLFDVDGTLLDYRRAQSEAVGHDAKLLELVNSPEVQSYEARGVPEPQGAMQVFLEGYFERLARQGELMPGVRDTLKALKGKVRFALVSNGAGEVQDARLAAGGIIDYFPVRVYSRDEGVAKPDPRILMITLERLGVLPEQAVFVGDSATSDMAAAQAAGVDFIWFRPDGRFDSPGKRIAEVTELFQLPELLARRSGEGEK